VLTRSGCFNQLSESSRVQQVLEGLRDWLNRSSRDLWGSYRTIRGSIRGRWWFGGGK
jgi:hypothetical protein